MQQTIPKILEYRLKIIDIIDEAPKVKTFRVQTNVTEISFMPGQFFMVRFEDSTTFQRAYSIPSSPTQKNHIDITMDLVGKFTHKLWETKVNDYVDDLHWKTINYLVKNYSTILLPKIDKKLTDSLEKDDNGRTNYEYGNLRHDQFRRRLCNKCKERNVNLIFVSEDYTSKTCSSCGHIKHDLGSSKIYDCNKCNLKIDRDVNAAKNIMIKKLYEYYCNIKDGITPLKTYVK